jgi:heptosyltransferase-3
MQRLTTRVRDAMLPVAARMRHDTWSRINEVVLIFQPDHLGDILLSQPAVQLLRRRYPEAHLVAVVGPWSREIASLAWPVDEIVTLRFPGFTREKSGSPVSPYTQLRDEARRLDAYHPRAAYVLRPDAWWSAWLASLVSPGVTTADDARSAAFATRTAEIDDDDHATVRAFRIAAGDEPVSLPTWESSPLALPNSAPAADDADWLLRRHQVSGPYAIVHPGSGAPVKEWPVHRWAAVINDLTCDSLDVVLTGSPAEADACAEIAARSAHCTSLAGQTAVPVLAEMLRGASIVLGPDCGPLHLAVATGTPTVHLFGPSDPRRYGPWGDPRRHHVVRAGWSCPRCGDLSPERPAGCGCMLAISPRDVVNAARSVLTYHAG